MNKEERQRRMKDRIRSCKSALPVLAQALKDPNTPKRARWLCALAVGYALSPLDLLPYFIPVLGALDDLFLLLPLITLAVKCIPAEVWQKCQAQAQALPPKDGRYALGVVLFWLIILLLILKGIDLL